MNKRTIDEMIAHFNQEVSNMDIAREYKMALLGMITAIGYESKKQEVVRCKDCKCLRFYEDGTWWCEQTEREIINPDWFCADGERRDNE